VSGTIKYTLFLFSSSEKKKRMSIAVILWCEDLKRLRDRTPQEEEKRQRVSSTVHPPALTSQSTTPPALTSQSTTYQLELLAGEVNNNINTAFAANLERLLSVPCLSSSAINKMMDCFCP